MYLLHIESLAPFGQHWICYFLWNVFETKHNLKKTFDIEDLPDVVVSINYVFHRFKQFQKKALCSCLWGHFWNWKFLRLCLSPKQAINKITFKANKDFVYENWKDLMIKIYQMDKKSWTEMFMSKKYYEIICVFLIKKHNFNMK